MTLHCLLRYIDPKTRLHSRTRGKQQNKAVNRSTQKRGNSNQRLPFVPGYGRRYTAERRHAATK